MKYLIIVLVIGLALAPLLHFLPSKRQRAIAGLREAAAVAGLFVEFRDLPGERPAYSTASARDRQLIYYGARLPPSRGKQTRAGSWLRESEQWRGLDRAYITPDQLADMPHQVLAASVDEASCGVYWREDGDAAVVEDIVRLISAWRDEIVG